MTDYDTILDILADALVIADAIVQGASVDDAEYAEGYAKATRNITRELMLHLNISDADADAAMDAAIERRRQRTEYLEV